jgi:hypothetical protein
MGIVFTSNPQQAAPEVPPQGGEGMERAPTTVYFWISRLAGFAGLACMIVALVSSITEDHLMARPTTYIQIAIAAFLVAIWAVLYEMRDRGIRTK